MPDTITAASAIGTTSTSSTSSAARSPWSGAASAEELAHWSAVAESVAATLATDALERDRAGLDPTTELDLLRDSGLVNLLHPAGSGGGGGHWETAFLVLRILARADASVSQLLGYHYVNSANIGFYGNPASAADWFARTVAGNWVWGDSVNPVDPDLELTVDTTADSASGSSTTTTTYRLNGLKRFSTGASSGDVTVVNALVTDGADAGKVLSFVLDHDRDGINFLGDWDALGQRLSASGSVRFDNVRVSPADVLGWVGDEPFSTLVTPGIQLIFSNLCLGIAQGALERGREITLARPKAWFLSGSDSYATDPLVQRLYGEFVARTAAVEALADSLGRRFDTVIARGAGVTAADRADIAVRIAQVKVVSTEVGIDVSNRIFEVTGSSSTRSSVGLDLFWRNVRTHSLHDPIDYKKLEVGANFLTGAVQPISLYT
jgi:alkylation response protein AidB-like acyl-CoA dehydrogenase